MLVDSDLSQDGVRIGLGSEVAICLLLVQVSEDLLSSSLPPLCVGGWGGGTLVLPCKDGMGVESCRSSLASKWSNLRCFLHKQVYTQSHRLLLSHN